MRGRALSHVVGVALTSSSVSLRKVMCCTRPLRRNNERTHTACTVQFKKQEDAYNFVEAGVETSVSLSCRVRSGIVVQCQY